MYQALSGFDALYTFTPHFTIFLVFLLALSVRDICFVPWCCFLFFTIRELFYKDKNTVIDEFPMNFPSFVCGKVMV